MAQQAPPWPYMSTLILLAYFVFLLVILSIALQIIVGAFEGKRNNFGDVILTSFIVFLVLVVSVFFGPLWILIWFILTMVILRERHLKNYTQALVATIAWIILAVIIIIVIAIVFNVTLLTFPFL